jgi:putative acetyltransferase
VGAQVRPRSERDAAALTLDISYLADRPELARQLIPGLLEHWRFIAPEATWESRVERFRALENRDVLPIGWIAHDSERAVGTAALRVTDLEGRDDLTPWLGGVYVEPSHRGRGIASMLCGVVERKARELGFPRLYLFTLDRQSLYARLGWRMLEPAVWRGHPASIMVKELQAAAVTESRVRIAAESPRQPEVLALIQALDAYVAALYPAESNHLLDVDALAAPDVRFFVARVGTRVVGCGALRVDASGYGEVKRMYIDPAARGLKLGRAILDRLESEGTALSLSCLRLETGVSQPEALGLYRSAGYREIPAFGAYAPDPLSVFMEKRLE